MRLRILFAVAVLLAAAIACTAADNPWLCLVGGPAVAPDNEWRLVVLTRAACPPCRVLEATLADHAAGLPPVEIRPDSPWTTPSGWPRPCLVLFHQGKECCRHYGALSYEQLRAWVTDCQAGRGTNMADKTTCSCNGDGSVCTCTPGQCACAGGDDCRASQPRLTNVLTGWSGDLMPGGFPYGGPTTGYYGPSFGGGFSGGGACAGGGG